MSYSQNNWKKGDVITSSKLNNIEQGIANIADTVDGNTTQLTNIANDISEIKTSVAENTKDDTVTTRLDALEEDVVKASVTGDGVKAQSTYNLVTNKVVKGKVTSIVWNEESGGGVQVKNTDANIISFIGVNNGQNDNDIWGQFYAKYITTSGSQTKNLGTRVNFTNHGVYYTKNKTSGAYTDDDELVTLATVKALEERIAALEAKLNTDKTGDPDIVINDGDDPVDDEF